jgi:hypothetical protein
MWHIRLFITDLAGKVGYAAEEGIYSKLELNNEHIM